MAFVEEEFLEEPIQIPLELPLYTVLDAHDSPNTNVAATYAVTAMDGATFIVQEELLMTDCRVEPPPLNPVED
jgi:hypothetical protein